MLPNSSHLGHAAAWVRLAFGGVLVLYGVGKVHAGVTPTAAGIASGFAGSWVPAGLASGFATALPFLEIAVGGWLLVGFGTRRALLAATLLIAMLLAGTTVLGDSAAVAQNLFYVTLLAALSMLAPDPLTLDHLLQMRSRGRPTARGEGGEG
jgi:hypothetical protein